MEEGKKGDKYDQEAEEEEADDEEEEEAAFAPSAARRLDWAAWGL